VSVLSRAKFPLGTLAFLAAATTLRGQDNPERGLGFMRDIAYTEAQAKRGEATFIGTCSGCHAKSQFTDASFVRSWKGRSVFELLNLIRATMPVEQPGQLPPDQYADVVAYILRLNGAPAGDRELPVTPAADREPAGGEASPGVRSTANGVYSAAQAALGRDLYGAMCQGCHTPASHSGPAFTSAWAGRSVADLFDFILATMPQSEPGILTPQEGAQLVAYLLEMNGMPHGQGDLPADSEELKRIRIAAPLR
jgi:mono/diheme cytochrome c family protein